MHADGSAVPHGNAARALLRFDSHFRVSCAERCGRIAVVYRPVMRTFFKPSNLFDLVRLTLWPHCRTARAAAVPHCRTVHIRQQPRVLRSFLFRCTAAL